MHTRSWFETVLCVGAVFAMLGAGSMSNPGKLSAADRSFLQQAAAAGTEEVNQGKAEASNSLPDARLFAHRMIVDHSKANAQLDAIAGSLGFANLYNAGVSAAKPVQKLSGTTYLHDEIGGHETVIAMFTHEVDAGYNPTLRDYAKQTLPVLRMHLALAKRYSM